MAHEEPVDGPERLVLDPGERDFGFAKVFSTSVVAHIAIVAALLLTPLRTSLFGVDTNEARNRFEKLVYTVQPPRPPVVFTGPRTRDPDPTVAPKKPGRFGRPSDAAAQAAPSRGGAPIIHAHKRAQDEAWLLKNTMLSVLTGLGGSGVFTSGLDGVNEALGGLTPGAAMVGRHGVGGWARRGIGSGGGGPDLIGIAGLNTQGGGPGGPGSLILGTHRKSGSGGPEQQGHRVLGGLDQSVVARIVRRHQNEIRYCYERQLQKDPNLTGRIAVRWVIDGMGNVTSATVLGDTVASPAVADCILTRVRRWRFPEPRGGGIVVVTYPWIFTTTPDR